MIMRLLMVERYPPERDESSPELESESGAESSQPVGHAKTSKFLPTSQKVNTNACNEQTSLLSCTKPPVDEKTGIHFYGLLLRQRRFTVALYSYMVFSILVGSFDATLPLHVQEVFGWGTFPTGIMFLALGAPGIVLSPLFGWLRDRVGTRHPTWIGFLALAPSFWLLGTPGDARFPWALGKRGEAIYIAGLVGIGTFNNLLNAVAAVESRCEHIHTIPSCNYPPSLLL